VVEDAVLYSNNSFRCLETDTPRKTFFLDYSKERNERRCTIERFSTKSLICKNATFIIGLVRKAVIINIFIILWMY